LVVEPDDGFFEIERGDDAAGPFPYRVFAQAIADRYSGDDPPDKGRRPGSGKPGRYSFVRDAAASTSYAKPDGVTTASALPEFDLQNGGQNQASTH
jgi:hypothetical protein